MLGSKSNSKKVLVTKNKLTTGSDASSLMTGNHLMKRYKSQEVYLGSNKKFGTKQSKEVQPRGSGTTNPTNNINTLGLPSTNSVNSININSNLNLNFNRSKELGSTPSNVNSKTPTQSGKKKNLSPDSGKIGSKMTAYILNKPKPGAKMPGVSKIMNDESIQELDTEENSNY